MKKRNWRLVLRRVLNLVFSRIVVTGVPNGSAAWALP